MRVSNEDWSRYIRQLSAVNRKAAEVMQSWMDEHPNAEGEDLVATAYAVSEYYGDAAGSLACSMYDALAEAQGAAVPPAEPAPNATYDETAKAVYGTLKNKQNTVPATVGRLVKQTGADTMLQNARRDRAQFAWIPMGDTCAFCLTLGSRGWQNQSKKAMKNGHAEHIHANCDCQYAVRFDGRSTVEGYDPDALKAQYDSFEGTPQEKINAWRREVNASRRDEINAQKRIAYRRRKGLSGGGDGANMRSGGSGGGNNNHNVFPNAALPNGLPIKGEPNSIADKVDENGKVLQRRIYGPDGMAVKDFDTTNHGDPYGHPTGAHKHVFDYSKRNPHSKPLPLTETELEENKDIIQRGDNYVDPE